MEHPSYVAVVERAGENYSAYLPDVPGCGSTGATAEEALRNLREALTFHLEGLKEDGEPFPLPLAMAQRIEADCEAVG